MLDALYQLLVLPFEYGFMVRALVVSVLAGIMCPWLGAYVVTRNLGFMGDALAHAVLPGMVGAAVMGFSPTLGAAPVAVAMALIVGFLTRRTGLSSDTTIGILFAGLFALGVIMLSLATGVRVNLEDLLLGQVLGATWTDATASLILAVAVALALCGLHRSLVFSGFDAAGAATAGLKTESLDYALLALLAIVVVMALQAVGIILVISLLITPAATALMLVRQYSWVMVLAVGLGILSAVTGLYLSFHFNLPSGPAMALVSVLLFAIGMVCRRWLGAPTQSSALARV